MILLIIGLETSAIYINLACVSVVSKWECNRLMLIVVYITKLRQFEILVFFHSNIYSLKK